MAVGCKVILRLFAISLTAFTTQAQLRTQWCDDDHDHDHHADHNHSHALPHPEDFLKTIFSMYGDNASCTIDHDGLYMFDTLLYIFQLDSKSGVFSFG